MIPSYRETSETVISAQERNKYTQMSYIFPCIILVLSLKRCKRVFILLFFLTGQSNFSFQKKKHEISWTAFTPSFRLNNTDDTLRNDRKIEDRISVEIYIFVVQISLNWYSRYVLSPTYACHHYLCSLWNRKYHEEECSNY